ncbi:MAG: class I SAM-dependent methyltransferase [Gammaproteobacteria bacterium]|nr:class I SAM-dependent methyltransferase [Gammaproteobacteria bacterium]
MASPALLSDAAALAAELALPLVTEQLTASATHWLVLTGERLELREIGKGAPGPIYVDFTTGAPDYRRRFGGSRQQPLARAVGLKNAVAPTVIDPTAGLGQDAFVLAYLGCRVHLVERSPVVAALLHDGLQRARQDPGIGVLVAKRLTLHRTDGRNYLQALDKGQWPDVIYLDPMYPHRRKSALASKEMRLLRTLVGDDDDASDLLAIALTRAQRRVVVKRPRLAPVLPGPTPDAQIVAPNTRFDLYLRHA